MDTHSCCPMLNSDTLKTLLLILRDFVLFGLISFVLFFKKEAVSPEYITLPYPNPEVKRPS